MATILCNCCLAHIPTLNKGCVFSWLHTRDGVYSPWVFLWCICTLWNQIVFCCSFEWELSLSVYLIKELLTYHICAIHQNPTPVLQQGFEQTSDLWTLPGTTDHISISSKIPSENISRNTQVLCDYWGSPSIAIAYMLWYELQHAVTGSSSHHSRDQVPSH